MFQGSMVALVTPMHEDGSLDNDALARLIEFHVENGTDAIVAVGTTGESPTVNPDEHIEVIRRTVELVAGRMPVIAGAGANATSEAIELAQAAADAGADATLQVTPYYNKPMQEGLYRHFLAVAEAVSCPHILYNVPGRTGVDLLPETIERLSHVENIVAVKEATGDPERTRAILDLCGGRLKVYSGEDKTAMESMLLGGHGDISVTANVAPRQCAEMQDAWQRGDARGALAIHMRLTPLHKALFLETSPAPVKYAVSKLGKCAPDVRLPLVPPKPATREQVDEAMMAAGLIN